MMKNMIYKHFQGVQELLAGQSVLSRPAEEFDNDVSL